MARPTKLTPELQAAVVQAIAAGNTRHDAAEYAGVGMRSLYRWLARGRKAKGGRYRHLWQAVKKAEADAVVRNVAIIQKAAQKTWQAAAWWLERKRGEDWSLMKGQLAELAKAVKGMEEEHERRQAATAPRGTLNGAGGGSNGHGQPPDQPLPG